MSAAATDLQRTPLHALHVDSGARMTPFAGWEMPLQYGEGLKAEHLWTRANAGLFDVSHMGQLIVSGPALEATLERAMPVDFDGWPDGLQRYTLLLNDAGGIDDDLMVTRTGEAVAIVVNAGCRDADLARLRALCPGMRIVWREAALLALQGPQADAALTALNPAVADLTFMQSATIVLCGAPCLVSRSGYTGEDGFEISVPAEAAMRLAQALLAQPMVKLVGLGARDTLRLEAGLHLYGQDMDAQTTVHEAALGWAIAKSRRAEGAKAGAYPGAQTTLREAADGPQRRLTALVGVEPVPVRHGVEIVDGDGGKLGVVTSGTVSPTLGKPVMLASVDVALAADAPLFAIVRGKAHPVARTTLPFVPKRYRRSG
ncbi:MAG: glycine cleavage system aminomethyltransferase GcvT [Proteobacteria bacterium]|nr:glycine cleavage system aminomethyltransferase GcvT [Pseudomonadota bacterium]